MLREIQEVCGFVSPEMKQRAAETLGVKEAVLTCVSGNPMLSKNGKILLKSQICLKQCRTSPNLMIDGKVYGHVKPEEIPELLSFLKNQK